MLWIFQFCVTRIYALHLNQWIVLGEFSQMETKLNDFFGIQRNYKVTSFFFYIRIVVIFQLQDK